MLFNCFLGILVISDGYAESSDRLKLAASSTEYSMCPMLCKDWSTPFYSNKYGGCVTIDRAMAIDDQMFCPDLETIKTWIHYEAFLSKHRMSEFSVSDVLIEMIDEHERSLSVTPWYNTATDDTEDGGEKRLQKSDARRRWFWPKKWFSNCGGCSSGYYRYKSCTHFRSRKCTSCRRCSSNEYETRQCSTNSDRSCAKCRTCASNYFETGSCTGKTNRVCSRCATCSSGYYQSRRCSGRSNTVCSRCTQCSSNQYQTRACSVTQNRICSDCRTCTSNQYVLTKCSSTQDTVCANCRSSCSSNEYESTKCSVTHDRVCSTCSTCNSGEFMSKPCMNSTNTVCSPCSTCRPNEFIVEKCSESKDTVCLNTDFILEKIHLDDLLHAAFEIVSDMRDSIGDFCKAIRNIYMALMNSHAGKKLILDVGGKLFNISPSTLRSMSDIFFERMFCEVANMTISGNGAYKIDRDPSVFEYILDYLRSGDMHIDSEDVNVLMQVLDDAEYFKLPSNLQDYLRWFSLTGLNLWFSEYAFINEQLKSVSKEMGGLLFKASEDGDAVPTSDSRCDNKGPSVIIVETISGNLFGGSLHANWSRSAGNSASTGAFLFRLRPSKDRYDQRDHRKAYAIHCQSNGHTLFIDNCMPVATCFVKSTGFNFLPFNDELNGLNGGEQFFRIKDYAVLQAKPL